MSRRCAFLDRDGVINVKPAAGEYVRTWRQFEFLPPAAEWVRMFNTLGYLVIVVSNQRGVARGVVGLDDLREIHRNMVEQLARRGARVDDVLFCPHEEGTCSCRKPRPGLVLEAQKRWDIDLAESLLVGDSECDRELARVCGLCFLRAEGGRIREVVPAAAGGEGAGNRG